jgi:hypothetical protein
LMMICAVFMGVCSIAGIMTGSTFGYCSSQGRLH